MDILRVEFAEDFQLVFKFLSEKLEFQGGKVTSEEDCWFLKNVCMKWSCWWSSAYEEGSAFGNSIKQGGSKSSANGIIMKNMNGTNFTNSSFILWVSLNSQAVLCSYFFAEIIVLSVFISWYICFDPSTNINQTSFAILLDFDKF